MIKEGGLEGHDYYGFGGLNPLLGYLDPLGIVLSDVFCDAEGRPGKAGALSQGLSSGH